MVRVFPLVIGGDFSLKAMQTQVHNDIDLAMTPASPATK
jgi:hypothetical protein